VSLPDPRLLPGQVRRAAAQAAHEAYDIAPWPDLEYFNDGPCSAHDTAAASCRSCGLVPRRHQRTGAAWAYLSMKGLIADSVGTGKTAICALVLAMCKQNDELSVSNRALVVCQAAAVGQITGQLRRLLPAVPVVSAAGTVTQRTKAYLSSWEVAVVSSATLAPTRSQGGDLELLEDFPVGILFYDDLDPMRNRTTRTSYAIRHLASRASRVHGLHATPLQKRLPELYCFTEPVGSREVFGSLEEVRQRYVTQEKFTIWVPVRKAWPSERNAWAVRQGFATYHALEAKAAEDQKAGVAVKASKARALVSDVHAGRKSLQRVLWKDGGVNTDRLPEFQRLLAPMVLRRTASDMDDTPTPEPVVDEVWVELAAAQRARYDELKKGVRRRLRNGTAEVSHAEAAAAWTFGAQICSGLAALDDGAGGDVSVKLDRVMDLVTGDLSEEKVVVYVHYKPNVAALSARLEAAGVGHVLFWSAENDAGLREARRRQFWEDPDCRVLVGTTTIERSLDLQVSRHLLAVDTILNASRMTQLLGRIQRQGSAYPQVFLHHFLAYGTQEAAYPQMLAAEAGMTDAVWNEEAAIFRSRTPRQVLEAIAA